MFLGCQLGTAKQESAESEKLLLLRLIGDRADWNLCIGNLTERFQSTASNARYHKSDGSIIRLPKTGLEPEQITQNHKRMK
jgi:hypothetical protein